MFVFLLLAWGYAGKRGHSWMRMCCEVCLSFVSKGAGWGKGNVARWWDMFVFVFSYILMSSLLVSLVFLKAENPRSFLTQVHPIPHSCFTVHRPSILHRPCQTAHRPPFVLRASYFTVRRPPSTVRPPPITVCRSYFVLRTPPFIARRLLPADRRSSITVYRASVRPALLNWVVVVVVASVGSSEKISAFPALQAIRVFRFTLGVCC